MTDFDANPFTQPREEPFTEARTHHEGRAFTRQADGRWLDDWGAEMVWDAATGKVEKVKPPPAEPYVTHSLSRWKDRDIPEPRFFMDQWIPFGRPVGLYGKPGARKSTLLLQWMIACQLGQKFGNIEMPLAYGPAYGLFCEDDEEIIAWRSRPMLKHYRATWDDMRDCHPESLVDANLATFCTFSPSGRMRTTPAWDKFITDIEAIRPVFVCLDILADFFGGDEIRRAHASAFLSLLHKTANQYRFACIYSAHPSLVGISSRTMTSGSTGFEGKVGARMTLVDPSDEEEDEDGKTNPIPNRSNFRTLALVKTNYAPPGIKPIDLVFKDGVFIPKDLDPDNKKPSPFDNAAADSAFLNRLKEAIAQGIYVSPSRGNSAGYAPTKFAGNGFTATQLAQAMKRLFDKKLIRLDNNKRGPARWVINEENLHA